MAVSIIGVSGTVAHGESIVIAGNGFGTKAVAKPHFWCDFGNGNLTPSSLGTVTSWSLTENIVYDASAGWQGGPCAKINPAIGSQSASNNAYTPRALFQTSGWYINTLSQKSFMYIRGYRNFVNGSLGGSGCKSWEMMPYFDQYTGIGNIVFNSGSWQMISQNISPDAYFYIAGDDLRAWQAMEWENQVASSLGGAAIVKIYQNSKLIDQATGSGDPNICYRSSAGNNMDQWDPIFHGTYSASGTYSQYPEYWSQIYLDNTWQRAYLSSRSTWTTASTWTRELVIPSAWSNTSITGRVINPGTFSIGTLAYLYVIDAAGLVNANGYEVTIGSGGGSPPTGTPVLSVR